MTPGPNNLIEGFENKIPGMEDGNKKDTNISTPPILKMRPALLETRLN